MSSLILTRDQEIATVALQRGKVNALNESMVEKIHHCFEKVERDNGIRAVIVTGKGKFFSFGFDIPHFLSYSKDEFIKYLEKFTNLYTYIFQFPKPVVAAVNGHAIAGGCMLATACDYRLMVSGRAKISLNEISFGSSVLAGSVEMLRVCVGDRNAESILYGGVMYSAEEASGLGLIDQITTEEKLIEDANKVAREFAQKDASAFGSIKSLLRRPLVDAMREREMKSILEFTDIWYSEETWENLRKIEIRS